MAFLDVRFPEDISDNATGGPSFSTTLVITGSGAEQRIARWQNARLKWDVSHALRTPAQMDTLIAFFRVAQGRLNGFRFRDPSDYEASDAPLSGAGATRQLVKRYSFGLYQYDRVIKKPVAGTVALKRNGANYSAFVVNAATGVVTLSGATDGAFTWSGEFDVSARFDTDEMSVSLQEWGIRDWQGIPIVELL